MMMLLLYLFIGLIMGLIFGISIGKTYALLYLDDDTNERIEHIRQQRIDIEETRKHTEELKLRLSRARTQAVLHQVVREFGGDVLKTKAEVAADKK